MNHTPDHDPVLDRAAALARDLEPTPLAPDEMDRWLDRAVADAARKPRPHVTLGRWIVPLAIAAGIAVAVLGGMLFERATPAPSLQAGRPLRLDLPTRDHIVAVPGARFEVQSIAPERRAIALRDGAMLFDVAPLRGASFEVVTAGARISVKGTVFSVRAHGDETVVHVYEGRVEVVDAAGTRSVGVDQSWASSDEAVAQVGVDLLVAEGERAASRRRTADSVASAEPTAATAAIAPTPSPAAATLPVVAEAPAAQIGLNASAPVSREGSATSDGGPAAVGLDEARGWIASGRGDEAVSAADRALAGAPASVSWKMLRADALQSVGRHEDAAAQYDDAATSGAAPTAGYQAARVRLRALHEPAGALGSLDASRADASGSPIAERALALRIDALRALGRQAEAARAIERYLAEFPGGGRAEELRAVSPAPVRPAP